jgi:hypothetical protein
MDRMKKRREQLLKPYAPPYAHCNGTKEGHIAMLPELHRDFIMLLDCLEEIMDYGGGMMECEVWEVVQPLYEEIT